jgi:Tol biopolymer transport system component
VPAQPINVLLVKMRSLNKHRAGWRLGLVPVAGFLLLAACEHSSALQPEPYPPAPPFSPLLPRRLTFNTGDDRTPAWLPDGSGILYSTERQDRADHDRCLALLPREGGTIRSSQCQLDPEHDDSTDLMEAPAVNANGQLFFHRVVSWVGQQKLGASALMLGVADHPLQATMLQPLPYTAVNGRFHSTVRTPQWLGVDSLVYLAEQLFYEGSTFYPDTFTTGLDVVLLDLSGSEPRFEIVPGTDYASGLDVSDDGKSLFYTLGGDSRVFQRDLATGAVTTTYDFGIGNIVRDPQVNGNTLVAIVGRSVLYRFEEAHGYVQRDEGGDLVVVDLTTSQTVRFSTDSVLFRHPAISPDGVRVVVETQPYDTVHHQRVSEYNAPNHRADLWLFGLE